MEESKEMSTKNKINSLINNIQNKLNKRIGNNYNINNTYNNSDVIAFNKSYKTLGNNPNPTLLNNYMAITNPNIAYQQISPISGLNELNLRQIIREEFSNLILPYQKDLINHKSNLDEKLDEIERNFKLIINAQNMGNLNDNAKIMSAYLTNSLSNNSNKNLEKFKEEYNSIINELNKKMNSVLEQLKIISDDNIKSENKLGNFENKIENMKKILDNKEDKNDNKQINIYKYLEKDIFDNELKKINQRFTDSNNNNNQNTQNIQKINEQIDNLSKLINQFKIEINKISGLDNNINSIRGDFGKITEDISSLKYQMSQDLINKINSLDFNKLKQQVSLIEFNKLKNDMNNFENNFYSVKNISESNDKTISDIKNQINDIEEKQNSMNKNIEEKINNKIKELSTKIEELSKKEKDKENEEKKDETDINNNNIDNKEEKKEEEPDLFIGSSRRQQRNRKSINTSINNNIKNQNNNNLDEKYLNLIKQLENINLDELQKMNFNNLLNQVGDLSRENKILSDKIEAQNKTIAEINEKINNLNLKRSTNIFNESRGKENDDKLKEIISNINSDLQINNIYQKNNNPFSKEQKVETNDNKQITSKKNSFIEEDYDDFDKDLNFDTNENNKDKEKQKEKEDITPLEFNNNKNNLIEDKNYVDDIIKKSKNEFGSFSKYSEVNILDQIMGVGDRDKKQGFGLGLSEPKYGGGSTFITGSLNENNNKNNYNEKLPIFEEDKKRNENPDKDKDLNKELDKDKKDENNDDDDFDNFDDFGVEEI